jgi:hypothetical protein
MVQVVPRYNLGSQLGASLGQGLQAGINQGIEQKSLRDQLQLKNQLNSEADLQKILLESQLASQRGSEMKNLLTGLGIPEDIATLYSNATEGGKTSILQNILDLEQRGLLGEGILSGKSSRPQRSQGLSGGNEGEFQFPELPSSKGLKPTEAVKREDLREKTNIPLYNETNAKLRNFEKESMSLKRLSQLNQSGKLPTGLSKFNINPKTGEIVFPALENPETQLFAKTINDFTTKAKDSFGSRVTNFELDRFLKRLPTLANSPSGRQLILNQMQVINDLDALEEKSLIDVYDHYGVGNINGQEAKKVAREYRSTQERTLKEKYDQIENSLKAIENQSGGSVPKGSVLLYDPEGNELHVPHNRVQEALKRGAVRR